MSDYINFLSARFSLHEISNFFSLSSLPLNFLLTFIQEKFNQTQIRTRSVDRGFFVYILGRHVLTRAECKVLKNSLIMILNRRERSIERASERARVTDGPRSFRDIRSMIPSTSIDRSMTFLPILCSERKEKSHA